jgi:hypothetical protein
VTITLPLHGTVPTPRSIEQDVASEVDHESRVGCATVRNEDAAVNEMTDAAALTVNG